MVTIAELEIADEPERWSALGFAVERDRCRIGAVDLRFAGREAGRGLVRWHLRELPAGDDAGEREGGGAAPDLDGLPTARAAAGEPPAAAATHPNGVTSIDHVVAISPDLDRTVAALERAGPRPAPDPRAADAGRRAAPGLLPARRRDPRGRPGAGGDRAQSRRQRPSRLLLGPRAALRRSRRDGGVARRRRQ